MSFRVSLAGPLLALTLLVPLQGFSCVGTGVAQAHVFVGMTIEHLATSSSRVIVGTPIQSTSLWEETDTGRRIVSYHRVQVHSNVVGDGPSELWVRRLGGVVDGIGQFVHGEAILRPNQPVLLFLVTRKDGTFSVLGMEQGCFPVSISKDQHVTIERRPMRQAPVPTSSSAPPATSIEGLSLEAAKRVISNARSRNAK